MLARVDGLPTRIAVGFLPGTPVGHEEWQVDGTDTHAWPQVHFEDYGWIDFEPTPGTSVKGSSAPALPTTASTTTVPSSTPTTSGGGHNLTPPGKGGVDQARGRSPAGTFVRSARPWALWLLVLPVGAGRVGWRASCCGDGSGCGERGASARAGILAAWREALGTLDLAGVRRRRAETYLELAGRVAATGVLSEEAELAFADLALLATTASYGDRHLRRHPAPVRRLATPATVVRSARRRIARWQRIVAAARPEEPCDVSRPFPGCDSRALGCARG